MTFVVCIIIILCILVLRDGVVQKKGEGTLRDACMTRIGVYIHLVECDPEHFSSAGMGEGKNVDLPA